MYNIDIQERFQQFLKLFSDLAAQILKQISVSSHISPIILDILSIIYISGFQAGGQGPLQGLNRLPQDY